MSFISESSSAIELQVVNAAVEHLQELADRMRSEEFGFADDDVENVDLIIESVRDLESETKKAHEKLETETIKSSVLRHTLKHLPNSIQRQIQDAVSSARNANATEITHLQSQLDNITANIEHLQNETEELESENARLIPERERVRQEHGDIIAQLNQRMSEKASNQIHLNETRDNVRETNQKIIDLEEGIIQLKEDLIQERADARMEKKRLKKAVYDTTVKTREQKEINIEKKREVDDLHEKVVGLEKQLADLRKSIRAFETSRSKLEGQERALTNQLTRQIKCNQDLKNKGLQITNEIAQQDTDYREKRAALEEEIRKLEEDLVYEAKREEENSIKRMKLQKIVKEKLKIRKKDEKRVAEQSEILQKAKNELADKAEELAKLRQETFDMETRMIELMESHEAIMETLLKQIQECKEQLSKERKERMELQERRDSMQKEGDDLKINMTRSINDMNQRIKEGKGQHDSLTKEGTNLQKSIRDDDDTIKKLEESLERRRGEFAVTKDNRETEINKLKEELEALTIEEVDKKEEIEERRPSFIELEKSFTETEDVYDKTKKEVIALKSKKITLEDSVKRSKKDLEKMINPRELTRKELEKKREEALQQLKKYNQEVKDIESKIFDIGTKLRLTLEENDRFKKANKQLEGDTQVTIQDVDKNEVKSGELEEYFKKLRDDLTSGWRSDRELEQEFCARDKQVVKKLGEILDKTSTREAVVSDITEKLYEELQVLSGFLDNVANRRPPGASSSMSRLPHPPASARSSSNSLAPTSLSKTHTVPVLPSAKNPTKKSVTISPRASKPNTPAVKR